MQRSRFYHIFCNRQHRPFATSNETDEKASKWAIYFERTSDPGNTWGQISLTVPPKAAAR